MTSYKNSQEAPPIMKGCPPDASMRVPRHEWDRPPWNRWSFQHVREFLPTVQVWRGNGPAFPLPGRKADITGVTFEDADGQSRTIAEFLDDTYTDGFLVIADGHIVHESYANGMRPETPHLMQSVSKSITGTVAGILIGRGMLNASSLVTDYLPELEDTAWRGASLQHVMDMTTGVQYNEAYTEPHSDIGKTDVASGWRPIPEDSSPDISWPECVWDQILTLKHCDAEHGERFLYRSIETDVLAHAMMRVSGMSLHELVSTELWQPMGAEEDGYFTVDKAGYALGDGGFNGCMRDFGRFGQLYLDGGVRNGRQIIPVEWIDDVRRGPHGLFSDELRQSFPNGCYRNQFWIEDMSTEAFMCRGVFGQLIYISPAWNMVVVKLSTWPDFINDRFRVDTQLAIHAIARALDLHGTA